MKLHVIAQLALGYAREDRATANALAVLTLKPVAEQLRLLAPWGSEVVTLDLDAVPPGLARLAEQIRRPIPEAGELGKTVYVVATLKAGLAREDADTANALGVFSTRARAEGVRLAYGPDAKVVELELDRIPDGLLLTAQKIGIRLAA